MFKFNILVTDIRGPEFFGSTADQCKTWMLLQVYNAEHENRGRIRGCASWSREMWMGLASVDADVVMTDCSLWRWEGDDLVVWGYPTDQEEWFRRQRERGKRGGQARAQAHAQAVAQAHAPANEEEKEKEKDDDKTILDGGGQVPLDRIKKYWNDRVSHAKMRSTTGHRRDHIRARWEEFGETGLFELIDKVAASDFLAGTVENSRWYGKGCTPDWAFRQTNATRILEGEFDNHTRTTSIPSSLSTNKEYKSSLHTGMTNRDRCPWHPDDFTRFGEHADWDAYMDDQEGTPAPWPCFEEWLAKRGKVAVRHTASTTVLGEHRNKSGRALT